MGAKQTAIYSIEMPGQQQPPNSTKIRRHPRNIDGLQSYFTTQQQTLVQMFQKSFKAHSNSNCIGTIVERPGFIGQSPQRTIEYVTYAELQRRIIALANALTELNICPITEEVPGQKMRLVGIESNNCIEWLLVNLVCCMYGMTSVPLYDSLSQENHNYIINHSGITVLFCSAIVCNSFLKIGKFGKVKTVVLFGQPTNEQVQAFKSKKISLLSLTALIEKGSQKPRLEYVNSKPEHCLTFSYTSGTTGQPKAVMLSHRNVCSCCTVLLTNEELQLKPSDVYMSYLPLPHIFERMAVYNVLYAGAVVCFSSGNQLKFKDDLELIQPTVLCSVPRVCSMFYDGIKEKFRQVSGCQKAVLQSALASKLGNVTKNGNYQHWLYDKMVFNKTKAAFGGRLRYLITGSAPLLSHIHSFMKVVAACPIFQGYGLTESTGGSFVTEANDPTTGHVGGPTSNAEFKLQDIPEMGYTHNDKDQKGRPYPRGEVCVRGPGVFLGYYKEPQKTQQVLDKDGWLHTGDVGAILHTNGALKLIDRKKNIFKLQQGDYIASKKVEGVYLKRPEVSEMFLYGDSTQSFVVAIIVPNREVIEMMGLDLGIKGSFEYLCTHPRIRRQLLTQLNEFASAEGLESVEQPKNVYLEPLSFQEKGILTNTLKLQRHIAKKLYTGQINAMYREGMFVGKEK